MHPVYVCALQYISLVVCLGWLYHHIRLDYSLGYRVSWVLFPLILCNFDGIIMNIRRKLCGGLKVIFCLHMLFPPIVNRVNERVLDLFCRECILDAISSLDYLQYLLCGIWCLCVPLTKWNLSDREYIFITPAITIIRIYIRVPILNITIIKSEIPTFPVLSHFSRFFCLRLFCHRVLSNIIHDDPGEAVF